MSKLRFYWISVLSLFSQCTQSQDTVRNLPAQLPANLTISLYQGGGMLPQSSGVYISADSCYMEYFYNQARNKIYFTLDKTELQDLYQVFVKNQFHRIKTYEEEVYDRGGTNLSLSFDTQYVNKSDGGMTFIQKNWQEAYSICLSAVWQIAIRKTEAQKKDIRIVLDPSILQSGYVISLSIEDSNFNYYSEEQGIKSEIPSRLFPGQHQVSINLIENTEPSYQRKSVTSEFFVFEVKKDTRGLRFSLKENHLSWVEF